MLKILQCKYFCFWHHYTENFTPNYVFQWLELCCINLFSDYVKYISKIIACVGMYLFPEYLTICMEISNRWKKTDIYFHKYWLSVMHTMLEQVKEEDYELA